MSTNTHEDETFTITHRTGTYYSETTPMTIIEAHDEDGDLASELYADIETGQIMQVETEDDYRGKGIASALIDYAVAHDIELYHSPVEHCTEEGLAFAEKNDQIDVIDPELAFHPA